MLMREDQFGTDSSQHSSDEGSHESSSAVHCRCDTGTTVRTQPFIDVQLGTSLHSKLVANTSSAPLHILICFC